MPADEFFVGYLPTPARQRRFLRIAVISLIVTASVLALVVAGLQHDPGEGQWKMDQVAQFDGVIRATPYPTLETAHGSLLLINDGKFGVSDRSKSFDGQSVTIKGHSIDRNDLSMIELSTDSDSLQVNAQKVSPPAPPPASNSMTMRVRGEIVDSKCFTGAMKPGDGKTHKACAALCIRGGIPPMLVSFDTSGRPTDYLLVDASGNALTGNALESVIPFVGEPVEVTGEAQQRGSLNFLRIPPVGAVRRL